jgi:hypothetical protein
VKAREIDKIPDEVKREMMLSEEEVRERAEYCYLVFLQLSRLRENDRVAPERYQEYLERSTLRLGEDAFIRCIIEEELKMGSRDGGLGYLIPLYEGFAHAYGEVLQTSLEEIRDGIPAGFREKLALEMERKLRKSRKKPASLRD